MIIDFWNRNGGSPTPTPTDLSGVVASADLSGTTLNLDNPSGTTIDSVDFSGIIPAPVETSGFVHSADFVVSSSTLNLENTTGATIDTIDLSSLKQDLSNYYTNTEADAKFPESTNIRHIIAISQADYDLISNPSSDTLYVINS